MLKQKSSLLATVSISCNLIAHFLHSIYCSRAQTNLFGLCTQLPTLPDSEKIGCTASFVPKFCGGFGGNRRYIPSVSSALIVGGVVGLLQAVFLIFAAKFVLRIMGVNSVSIYS